MTLFFMHIPKSAGTTLSQVFERQFGEHDIYRTYGETPVEGDGFLRQPDRERYRLVIGHFEYGIHTGLNTKHAYAAMLRHPFQQVVSHYNHLSRSNNPFHRQVMARHKDLTAFSQSNWSRHFLIRRLTGATVDEVRSEPDRYLRIATENLDQEFAWIGVQERFDESLLLLGDTFGWTELHYRSTNFANPGQKSQCQLTRTEKQSLQEATAHDVAAYEFAIELINSRVTQTPDWQQRLARFRNNNNQPAPKTNSVLRFLRRIVPRGKQPDTSVSEDDE